MEILDLGGAGEENIPPRLKSRKKTKLKVAVGIGSLAAVTGLGSTLAASITLNSDSPVEFGQGVATTAACDTDGITLTPTSEYVPSSELFRLDTIQLSGVNTDTPDPYTGVGCAGKTLIIHAYTDDSTYASSFAVGGSTANPLYFTKGYFYGDFGYYHDAIAVTLDSNGDVASLWGSKVGNNTTNTGWDDFYISAINSGDTGAFTIELNTWDPTNPGLDSRAVSKFTIESIDTPANGLGDSGDWYSNGIN